MSRGHDHARQIRVEPRPALLGLERNDAGEDGDTIGFHRVDEALELIDVIDGLGLQHPRAGVDLAARVLDLGVELRRAGIGRGTEEQLGRARAAHCRHSRWPLRSASAAASRPEAVRSNTGLASG